DVVLNDAVVRFVFPDAVECRLVDAEPETRHGLDLARLFVLDGQGHDRSVRRDRLDDQVVVLRGRVVLGNSPDAGERAWPRNDPELVLLLEPGAERRELRDRLPRIVVVSALD